eukprot:GHVT01026299.1.p1 GENE.GHVT01026299.1~~GHVT01026299.1.p1  ORF type:complete len:501 (+),score=107.79 GHVT01026299.1:966-2468(+)
MKLGRLSLVLLLVTFPDPDRLAAARVFADASHLLKCPISRRAPGVHTPPPTFGRSAAPSHFAFLRGSGPANCAGVRLVGRLGRVQRSSFSRRSGPDSGCEVGSWPLGGGREGAEVVPGASLVTGGRASGFCLHLCGVLRSDQCPGADSEGCAPSSADASLRLLAPAKVNLFLRVTGRRPDGFHLLSSLFHTVGLADVLKVDLWNARGGDAARAASRIFGPTAAQHLELGGRESSGDVLIVDDDSQWPNKDAQMQAKEPAVPADGRNFVLRAVAAYRRAVGRVLPFGGSSGERLAIWLQKKIPAQAGLGGGSSDAAAALFAANLLLGGEMEQTHDLKQTEDTHPVPSSFSSSFSFSSPGPTSCSSLPSQRAGLSRERLASIGSAVGSDVPFFLLSHGAALCGGVGEAVVDLPPPSLTLDPPSNGGGSGPRRMAAGGVPLSLLRRQVHLLKPAFGLPTPQVGTPTAGYSRETNHASQTNQAHTHTKPTRGEPRAAAVKLHTW